MDVSIDETALGQLNTDDSRALHEFTDKLSSHGVGRIVDLPQIIVVGAQSSGKSSVLEAISRVHFPVQEGVCTRFATELILRHAEKTHVEISVKFADSSKSTQSFQRSGFSEEDLPGIIKEARELMGLSKDNRGFSRDVLRLEIEGPKMYPLTLVDLPGLYQNETEGQTFEGIGIVKETVENYMKRKNSIILAIISANRELADQGVLRKVKEHDPSRERTIGIITKPDMTRPGSNHEQTYLRVARNEEKTQNLKLGWHVMRNRAEDESDLDQRDAIEERFFDSGAWNSIAPHDRGVASLREKLSQLLFRHIKNSLPGVIEEIERKLDERRVEQGRLGRSRSGVGEKRSFLIDKANQFQRLARDGILGHYKDVEFFGGMDDDFRKMRAQLRNFNRAFDYVMRAKGASRLISRNDFFFSDSAIPPPPPHLKRFLDRYPYVFPHPPTITREALSKELQTQASINQGLELPGLPNSDLAIQLFRKQAEPWERIAKYHISQVTTTVKAFVDELFAHIFGPPENNNTTEAVLRDCVDPFFLDKEKILQAKLGELLRPYIEGYAFPLDADFHQTTSSMARDRLTNMLFDTVKETQPELFEEKPKQKFNAAAIAGVLATKEELDGGEFGTEKVIDMMKSYYESSRRTFTENVINLAIESCLICDIPSILTPTKVDGMTEEQLEQLASESKEIQSRREHLEREIEILREGRDLFNKHRARRVTARPSLVSNGHATTSDSVFTVSTNLSTSSAGNKTKAAPPLFGNPGPSPYPPRVFNFNITPTTSSTNTN